MKEKQRTTWSNLVLALGILINALMESKVQIKIISLSLMMSVYLILTAIRRD
jgi:hypothetical protein